MGPTEKFTWLLLWRNCMTYSEWKTYCFLNITFGNQPASVQLEVAKSKCAEASIDIDDEASSRILTDMHVDDGASGGSMEQFLRFMGDKNPDGSCSGTIPRIRVSEVSTSRRCRCQACMMRTHPINWPTWSWDTTTTLLGTCYSSP